MCLPCLPIVSPEEPQVDLKVNFTFYFILITCPFLYTIALDILTENPLVVNVLYIFAIRGQLSKFL